MNLVVFSTYRKNKVREILIISCFESQNCAYHNMVVIYMAQLVGIVFHIVEGLRKGTCVLTPP